MKPCKHEDVQFSFGFNQEERLSLQFTKINNLLILINMVERLMDCFSSATIVKFHMIL